MRRKVVIVGAGGVGTNAALFVSREGFADVHLVDINGSLAKGKACDLQDLKGFSNSSIKIEGYHYLKKALKNADVVVITAGIARKPGIERSALMATNLKIVKEIVQTLKSTYYKGIVIPVTNPLDVVTHQVYKILGLPRERVFGMGPILDTARFKSILASYFNVSPLSITTFIVGQHGKYMVPLLSRTMIGSEPIQNLVKKETLKKLKDEVVGRGATIVSHLKTGSATISPGAGVAELVKSVILDEHRIIPVSFPFKGEHGFSNISIGYPCIISGKGAQIFPVDLKGEEEKEFKQACAQVKSLIKDAARL